VNMAGRDKGGNSLWKCLCDCGKEKTINMNSLRGGYSKSCGCLQKEGAAERNRKNLGNKSSVWKGGRHKDSCGYIRIYKPDHPNSDGKGYIGEHIFIMSEYLGRSLLENEKIHHRNGIREDNRIKNLELWLGNHPNGQRVEDLVPYWIEMLERYAPDKLTLTI